MAFQLFTRSTPARGSGPMVSIHRRGTALLNSAAVDALCEATTGHADELRQVEFLYDRATSRIGLRVPQDATNGYMLRRTSSCSYIVSAHAFLRHFGISHTESHRYSARREDGLLIVDLRGTKAVTTGSARRHERVHAATHFET